MWGEERLHVEQLYKAELDPYLLVPKAHFSNLVLSSTTDLISLRGGGGGGKSLIWP